MAVEAVIDAAVIEFMPIVGVKPACALGWWAVPGPCIAGPGRRRSWGLSAFVPHLLTR